jgi:hypothetical protein
MHRDHRDQCCARRPDDVRVADGEQEAGGRLSKEPADQPRLGRACESSDNRWRQLRSVTRSCRKWQGTDRHGALRACTAALLFALSVQASASLEPLLGASLTWAVSRRFTAGERYVNFTLRTAFQMADTCNYTIGRPVECPTRSPSSFKSDSWDRPQACDHPGGADVNVQCKVAAIHGVLCIGQVVQSSRGLELMYSNMGGEESCVSDIVPGFLRNTTLSFDAFNATIANADHGRMCNDKWCNSTCATSCTHTRDAVAFSSFSRCMHKCFIDAAFQAPVSHVGKANEFTVTSMYPRQASAHHDTNGVALAIGILQHQVQVAQVIYVCMYL